MRIFVPGRYCSHEKLHPHSKLSFIRSSRRRGNFLTFDGKMELSLGLTLRFLTLCPDRYCSWIPSHFTRSNLPNDFFTKINFSESNLQNAHFTAWPFYWSQFFRIYFTECHFHEKQYFLILCSNFSEVISLTTYYLFINNCKKKVLKAFGSVQNFY